MKKILLVTLIVLALPTLVLAQSRVKISPEKPILGQTVSISYDLNDPEAKFTSCDSLYLVERNIISWKDFDQFAMSANGNACQVDYFVYPRTNVVAFYFQQNGINDQNGGFFWELIAHEADGVPVKNAYLFLSSSRGNLPYSVEEIARLQHQDYRMEAESHPDDIIAQARYWDLLIKQGANPDSLFASAAPLLDKYWNENRPDPAAYSTISYAYRQLKQPQIAEEIRNETIEAYPLGELAITAEFQEISRIEDPSERAHQIDGFLARFPEAETVLQSYYLRSIYTTYMNAGRVDDMLIWAKKYLDSDTYFRARTARTLALELLALGEVDEAHSYANWALDNEQKDLINSFYRVVDDSTWIPTSLHPEVRLRAERHRNAENRLALAKIHIALEQYDLALEHLTVAARHIVDNTEVFYLLADVQEKTGNLQAAFDGYYSLALKFPEDQNNLQKLQHSYDSLHGSLDGFDAVQSDLQKAWDAKPHPVFSIDDYYIENDPFADLNETVKLASERKKRIMLFVGGEWCTWCHALTRYFEQTESVARALQENYIIMKVNYSTENPNVEFLSQYPPISGYPYLFILESDGTFLHAQDTGSLEQGVGMAYYEQDVLDFLNKWKPDTTSRPE